MNVISEEICNILPNSSKLRPPESTLLMYDKSELRTVGILTTTVENPKNNKGYVLDFYVVPNQRQPILGAAACQLMQLLTIRKENILVTDSHKPVNGTGLSREYLLHKFSDIFKGFGKLEGTVHLEVDPNVQATRLPLRKLPIAIKSKVKLELDRMTEAGIITPVQTPTAWISALLVVMKADGRVRICIDPKPLNKALKRNHYLLPVMEDFLPELQSAKIFSTVDAKDGFWHVCLDEESSYLTTFETPFGKYRWNRLAFGLSVSPEEFQRRLNEALSGLQGIAVVADDILIYGCGETIEDATRDHDRKLIELLERCRQTGIRLNPGKLKLHLHSVPYMGHILTDQGLRADPQKIEAIQRMPVPKDKQAVQRLLGMVNYLAKFVPEVSNITAPLRSLLHHDIEWVWDKDVHGKAFEDVKQLLQNAPVLKYFDSRKPITVQCDSSQSGLGACLIQDGCPVAYASRSLTTTEENYAQIEKETLAIVFAMEKFHMYVYGKDNVTVETDHKPLISIFNKALNNAPRRLQRMLLRLQQYQFFLKFRPGTEVIVADTLSRAYMNKSAPSASENFEEDIAAVGELSKFQKDIQSSKSVEIIVASDYLKKTLRLASSEDSTIKELQGVIRDGWPDKQSELPVLIRDFFPFRDELVIEEGILFKGNRIYVPASVREEILQRIHASHIGVNSCIRRARESVFWPNMTRDISKRISSCTICAQLQAEQSKEPLLPHDIPERPWQKVACDLFEFNHVDYLITVDYYSNFFEVDRLADKRAAEVIRHLKNHFARHGLPDVVMSDNGPPFQSAEFKAFAVAWEFNHITSSPRYSQSNGKIEKSVNTVKNLMKKSVEAHSDPYLALLDWRNTPSEGYNESPSQRLFSRRTRTKFPVSIKLLRVPGANRNKRSQRRAKSKQQHYYNRGAYRKPELAVSQSVRAKINESSGWVKAEVIDKLPFRSYTIETENGGTYRRNRRHLRLSNEAPIVRSELEPETTTEAATDIQQPEENSPREHQTEPNIAHPQTRSGRTVKRPAWMKDFHIQ